MLFGNVVMVEDHTSGYCVAAVVADVVVLGISGLAERFGRFAVVVVGRWVGLPDTNASRSNEGSCDEWVVTGLGLNSLGDDVMPEAGTTSPDPWEKRVVEGGL